MQALHDADEVSTQKRGGHLMSPFDNSSCIASDDIPKALKSSLKNAVLVNALFLTVAVTGLMVGQADDPIDKAIKEGKWPHYFRHLYYFFWCNAYFMFISATSTNHGYSASRARHYGHYSHPATAGPGQPPG